MGNVNSVSPRPSVPDDAINIFNQLDVERKGFLTLKDLIDRPHADFTTPRSLPAIFFFDRDRDGTLTADEFRHLLRFLQNERHNLETSMKHDKPLRDLIYKASLAGVKDCSVHGRSSYRRFSSFRNVRSVYSSRSESASVQPSSSDVPPPYPTDASAHLSTSPSDHSHNVPSRSSIDSAAANPRPDHHPEPHPLPHSSAESSLSTETDDHHDDYQPAPTRIASVSMFSSQREFESVPARLNNPSKSDSELSSPEADHDPRHRTALDAAVLEKIMHANIHKLADLLHEEGYREQFMAWLWRLADFKNAGVVTIDELRVFLEALKEDSIDLHELVFYREPQATLEQSIINEFDTTHVGRLCRDEFMVLADLITREYEFWENRHLERVGDYELGRTIGRGSSGVVRYATHVETREKVAMKIIKKGKCSDLSRLDREIQSLMAAKHKNIVALHEVLESENNLHIVMELCGGGSMVDIVRLYPEERMPEETARFFMRQVFEALSYCHEIGICHRDVRLDNLMLDNSGNMKITDFGHSGMFTPGWDMFSSALVGSVFNLSPEQIMGHVYSGEKIDIWSAGVAVYCLLVGRPPFYEPEVNALLERILTCDFEIPDFLSASAGDFIRCMIRAVPAERIPLHQMLHHPWFYDGPEFGPSMNVVAIPVDKFFVKRPDIAEMIMAMTIYQHHLHFHLADAQNPRAAPQTLRGQEWTLKCLCPKNDIKFTVSLFTRKPEPHRRRKKNVQLTSPVSLSTLTEPAVLKEIALENPRSTIENPLVRKRSDHEIEFPRRTSLDMEGSRSPSSEMLAPVPRTPSESFSGFSPGNPPGRRRKFQITPMDIAAQLRQTGGIDFSNMGFGEILDFDSESNPGHFSVRTFRDDMLSGNDATSKPAGEAEESKRICGHSRWRSFETPNGNLRRLNRSATVDAFPYQKVYPKRKMPESARKLNFDRPHSPAPDMFEQAGAESEHDSVAGACEDDDSSRLESTGRHSISQRYSMEETSSRLSSSASHTDQEIAQKLCRHPSKAISPQSPQISRVTCASGAYPIEKAEPDSKQESASQQKHNDSMVYNDVGSRRTGAGPSHLGVEKVESKGQASSHRPPQDDFQPYIEVRLQDGESGLFLKICRTLKAICTTKLKAAAEQKKVTRRNSRRSLSALRRTASGRSMESDVTVD